MTNHRRLAGLAAAIVLITAIFAGCKAMGRNGDDQSTTNARRATTSRVTTSTASPGAVTTTPEGDSIFDRDIGDDVSDAWDTVRTGVSDAIDTVSTMLDGN